ncbi:MAG: SCO family protein [Rhodobacteraceae bacterium]|nr:SCO family protein [Paracoccaceae bacterium]MCW9043140.1 SCO family protein [Pseudopelagicola sp.]
MLRTIAILALVFVGGVLGSLWYVTRDRGNDDQFAQCRMSAVAGGSSAIGGPFELVSETGETVTDKDVFTEPSLLYFGYTFCPDVCPLDTARNAEAITLLEERGQMVQPVFISVDADRDTPETMKEFTDIMHPRMLGLTGSAEQVKAASQAYRTYYKKQDDGDPEYFLIDHSTFSYLVLPEHGFVEYFKRDLTPEQVADQIGCFLSKM